jgi:hypothetical protein
VLRYDGDHIKMSSETALMKTPAVNIFFVFKQREIFLCVYNNNIYFYVDILFFFFFVFLFFTINIKIYFKLKNKIENLFSCISKIIIYEREAAERRIFSYICETEDSFQVSVYSARSIAEQRESLSLLKFQFFKGH